MHYVNNNIYLELAKLDYNKCQALHHLEWNNIRKWYGDSNLGQFGISQRSLLFAYFLATASVFEPEGANVRLAWAKTNTMIAPIKSYLDRERTSKEQRIAFFHDFRNSSSSLGYWEMWLMKWQDEGVEQGEAELLVSTINLCAGHRVSEEILSHAEYQCLSEITNKVCYQLREYQDRKVGDLIFCISLHAPKGYNYLPRTLLCGT
ncbi:unnamed protein product [Ilex paraguariensis]|uniref:Terpene synthase metal-binding domain-containing protein n=1 Tax=Ilex paraguariensis TaxID=185542 RepID=A0ABC8TDK4_9AQUA